MMDFDRILDAANKHRSDRLEEFGEMLNESFGVKPHVHPPSLERCTCTDRNRLRITLNPEKEKP